MGCRHRAHTADTLGVDTIRQWSRWRRLALDSVRFPCHGRPHVRRWSRVRAGSEKVGANHIPSRFWRWACNGFPPCLDERCRRHYRKRRSTRQPDVRSSTCRRTHRFSCGTLQATRNGTYIVCGSTRSNVGSRDCAHGLAPALLGRGRSRWCVRSQCVLRRTVCSIGVAVSTRKRPGPARELTV